MRKRGLIYTGMPERFRIPGQMVEYTTLAPMPPYQVALYEADADDAIAKSLPDVEEEKRLLGLRMETVKLLAKCIGALIVIGGGIWAIKRWMGGKKDFPTTIGAADRQNFLSMLDAVKEKVTQLKENAKAKAGVDADLGFNAIINTLDYADKEMSDPRATTATASGLVLKIASVVRNQWGGMKGMPGWVKRFDPQMVSIKAPGGDYLWRAIPGMFAR